MVDAIMMQLWSRHTVSVVLYAWTSTNKVTIMSVISYYMDPHWALREVQHSFDDVDCLFFSSFEN